MAAAKASDLTLGNYLKIVSKGAVYNNLSEDSPVWEMIKKIKKGPAEGRELRYLLRTAYGSAAVGFVAVNGGAYPTGSQATIVEGIAQYKDFALTVEVERTLIAKAISDFSRYGEPLAEELRSKSIAMSRILSAAAYADGTGVIAEASGAGTITGGDITMPIEAATTAKGFVGWIEVGDHVHVVDPDGTIQTPTLSSGTYAHYTVVSKDRGTPNVVLSAENTAGSDLTVTVTNIADGDFLVRGSTAADVFQDLSSIGSTDFNTLSNAFVGLDALTKNDGSVVHGITLNTSVGGTRRSVGGNPIDSQDFQQLMSQVKIAVGANRYKYSMAMMSWETMDALVESRETDRRFNSIMDDKRGVARLGYVHGKDTLMFESDEFCPKQRIYCLPEGDVLQFHGSDFEFVQPENGQKFFLKPNSSGHDRTIRAYMEGDGSLISVHNGGMGVIEDFVV